MHAMPRQPVPQSPRLVSSTRKQGLSLVIVEPFFAIRRHKVVDVDVDELRIQKVRPDRNDLCQCRSVRTLSS